MELREAILSRRSIRRFTDQPIERETIERIVAAAAYAPSWKNTQITRYTVVTDKALLERIAEECVLGFAGNTAILKNCAALAVQSVIKGRSGYERDGSFTTAKGDRWESFDAGISAQTFCLAAHELGVGTCILGIFDDEKLGEAVGIPEGQTVTALIPMGYAAETPKAPRRKDVSELVRFL